VYCVTVSVTLRVQIVPLVFFGTKGNAEAAAQQQYINFLWLEIDRAIGRGDRKVPKRT